MPFQALANHTPSRRSDPDSSSPAEATRPSRLPLYLAAILPGLALAACVPAPTDGVAIPDATTMATDATDTEADADPASRPLQYAGLSDDGTAFQAGRASFYRHGSRTANGERFDPSGMTAAHRTLPFGSRVRVVHPASGREVVVRINDRGPFTGGRVIDLAEGAARRLGITRAGVAPVELYRVE